LVNEKSIREYPDNADPGAKAVLAFAYPAQGKGIQGGPID
jgi:hypothetical protein